ncbi:MAG: hypothetical protein QXS38_00480 [Candidatus Pacearchaeota archaeon]
MVDRDAKLNELELSPGKEIDLNIYGRVIKSSFLGRLKKEPYIVLGTEGGRVLIYIPSKDIQKRSEKYYQIKSRSDIHFINIDSIPAEHARELGLISSVHELN